MIHIWVLHSFLSNIDIIIFFWGCSYLDDIVMIQTWGFHLPERPTVIQPDGTVLLEDDTDDFGADLDNHDDDNIDFILMRLPSA